MPAAPPRVTIAIDPAWQEEMVAVDDLERLRAIADVRIVPCHGQWTIDRPPPADKAAENALAAELGDCDALVVAPGAPRVTDDVISRATTLGFIGELEGDRFFARIDLSAAQRRGIVVTDATDGSSGPVAEFALGLAILGRRDAWRYIRRLQAGDEVASTARKEVDRIVNAELTGSRVGLVGFGHIGWRLTDLVRPFSCDVIAFDPFAPRELASATDVSFARSLETVFCSADVVICLAPLTEQSAGMIGAAQLRLMRPGTVFVNVSRGGVVKTDELAQAAAAGEHIYCLDVLDPEPIPAGHPLRELPNVVLTPHLAGASGQSRRRFFSLMVDDLQRHFSGLEPHGRMTPHVLAGRLGASRVVDPTTPTEESK